MRILVTGAAGFIGARLIRHLSPRHEVIAVTRGPAGDFEGVDWLTLDLSQPLDTARLPAQVDGIVHLAQSRRYREFPDGAADVFGVNVRSTFDLLEYARAADASSFVFTSTGGVYGHSYERLAETDPVNPLTFYFSSKYASELLLANYRTLFHTVVLRLFFVYGAGQRGMLLPSLVDRVERGEIVSIEGDPGLRINPLHVDDAVRVFEPALELGRSGVFNVAGGEEITVGDLVRLIGELAGRQPRVQHVLPGPNGDLVGEIDQMREQLGVEPRVTLREGLAGVIEQGRRT